MVDLARVNMGQLSDGQRQVLERVAGDGFLINYGARRYATAAGRRVPGATVRALLKGAWHEAAVDRWIASKLAVASQ
jgi:hypothetical protein